MSEGKPSFFFSPSGLFSFGLAVCLLALLAGRLHFWELEGAWTIVPSTKVGLIIGFALCTLGLLFARFRIAELKLETLPFAFALSLLFLSDWLCRNYNLLQGPSIRGEILLFSGLAFLTLRAKKIWPFKSALPICCALLSFVFLAESKGNLLSSDDNATFVYRLALLKENFPSIPFYYPLWNAGLDARDFFATGALNVYLLALPLIQVFEVEKIYNLIIVLVLFFALPCSCYFAAKLERFPRPTACLAGLLALGSSLLWYRWALKYGTLGFVTSVSLMPLNLALANRILSRDRAQLENYQVLLSLLSFTLMFLWSPSAIAWLPFAGLALLRIRSLLSRPKVLTLALGLLLLNLPWATLFWKVSKVDSFLSADTGTHQHLEIKEGQKANEFADQLKAAKKPLSARAALKTLREFSISTNPLIIFLILPGLALLAKEKRYSYAALCAWLVTLGLVLPALKPQLEFDRMLVVFSIIASLPVALCLEQLIRLFSVNASAVAQLLTALCLGFTLAAPFSVCGILSNRSVEKFYFADKDFYQMAEEIKARAGDARILFSGFVLHELNGSHLAPLSIMTNKALIASSPFHNLWRYKQVIPKEFLARGDSGINEYLDLLNVGHVFAHERQWKEYFRARPQEFEQVWVGKRFVLFRRSNYQNSYFQNGQGALLEQTSNSVRVRVDVERAILKFNYFPFLESSACTLAAAKVSENLTLIELSRCTPGQEVTIRAKSPWARLWQRSES